MPSAKAFIVAVITTILSTEGRRIPANAFAPAGMSKGEVTSRRKAMQKAATLLAGAAGVAAGAEGASAKAGEFGKQSLFGDSPNVMSSPYVDGGPKGAGDDTTFGVSKSEGPILATGYEKDVSRENKAFLESARRFESLQPKIDKKEWWFVRDELRIQAYTMRASMLALNKVNSKPDAAKALYEDFWTKVETFDEGCRRKNPELANAGYKALLGALGTYKKAVA
jgi:hypothetical protein